ncbi:MAG: hypothetical protein EOP04_32545 [Proteobacteria bacterium]|nr:MAG: hypothetical protein EOP04_32545 [Pseudomonadota bacterium]
MLGKMVLFTAVLNCFNHDIWKLNLCPVNFLDGQGRKSLSHTVINDEKKLDTKQGTVITSSGVYKALATPPVDIPGKFRLNVFFSDRQELAHGLLYPKQDLMFSSSTC